MSKWTVETDGKFKATAETLTAEVLTGIFHEAEKLKSGPEPETAVELLDSRIETHVVKIPNTNRHLLIAAVAIQQRVLLLGVGSSTQKALIGQVREAARSHFNLINPTIERILK